MTTPDNRIRLTPPLVDFDEIGTTGKAHDTFPEPGQARFDWMRSFLIGLLANQASSDSPVEFRAGSIWYDFKSKSYKFRDPGGVIVDTAGDSWETIAKAIELTPGLSLAAWYDQIKSIITEVDPTISATFPRHTNATASEPISAGSLVDVASDGKIGIADSSGSTRRDVIGVATITSDVDGVVPVLHVGLTTLRMEPGLSLSPGDTIYLASNGRGTNSVVLSALVRVGVVFDTSGYESTADDPAAKVVILLDAAGSAGDINAANSPAYVFVSPDDLNTTDNDLFPVIPGQGRTIDTLVANVRSAPTGADIIVEFLLVTLSTMVTDSSLGTVTIAAGTFIGSTSIPAVNIPTTKGITMQVNQVGLTLPGTTLTGMAKKL